MATQSAPIHAWMKQYYSSKHATISFIPYEKIILCTANAAYIPLAEFQQVLDITGELVQQESATKFIFDKRKLTAFHQPSMEWYHLVWKEKMYNYGLRSHRKILPEDKMFEQHVIAGRKKIMRENPGFDFDKYDIVYCSSIEEAIEK